MGCSQDLPYRRGCPFIAKHPWAKRFAGYSLWLYGATTTPVEQHGDGVDCPLEPGVSCRVDEALNQCNKIGIQIGPSLANVRPAFTARESCGGMQTGR